LSKKNKKDSQSEENKSSAWLSMKTGLILMGILSAAMVAWVTLQADPAIPIGERILWGLGFAVSIWIVFAVFYVINRYVFKR
jgi:uncharacterized membrane-anchored protein